MSNKRTLSILILGSPLLFGVNDASAFRSDVDTVATYCSSRGYDLLPAYASDTCTYCHNNKREYTSGNYEFFCPAPAASSPVCTDADGDGYFKEGTDCGTEADFNDNNGAAYPGATENCSDGVDNDGNGLTDAADPNAVGCSSTTVCTDVDGDGYSTEGGSCGPMDCDDNNGAINPGAAEACGDGIDNNCNGLIDTADQNAEGCTDNCTDQDGDAFSPDGGACGPVDCNDNDPAINPRALELCNDGMDNNCNNKTDSSDSVCQDAQADHGHWWRPDINDVNSVPTPTTTPRPTPTTTPRPTPTTTPRPTPTMTPRPTPTKTPRPTPTTTPRPTQAPSTQHPFGWNDPESQHQHEDYAVSSCTSCHTIDTADRNSPLSCLRCHGNVWGDDEDRDEDHDEDRHHSEDRVDRGDREDKRR